MGAGIKPIYFSENEYRREQRLVSFRGLGTLRSCLKSLEPICASTCIECNQILVGFLVEVLLIIRASFLVYSRYSNFAFVGSSLNRRPTPVATCPQGLCLPLSHARRRDESTATLFTVLLQACYVATLQPQRPHLRSALVSPLTHPSSEVSLRPHITKRHTHTRFYPNVPSAPDKGWPCSNQETALGRATACASTPDVAVDVSITTIVPHAVVIIAVSSQHCLHLSHSHSHSHS